MKIRAHSLIAPDHDMSVAAKNRINIQLPRTHLDYVKREIFALKGATHQRVLQIAKTTHTENPLIPKLLQEIKAEYEYPGLEDLDGIALYDLLDELENLMPDTVSREERNKMKDLQAQQEFIVSLLS